MPARFAATQEQVPQDPRGRRTRQSLREAMEALLQERDFRDLTLTDIASTAGVARQTVYDHYDNKEALFLGILADLVDSVYTEQNIPHLVHYLRTGEPLQGLSLSRLIPHRRVVFRTAVDHAQAAFTDLLRRVLETVMRVQGKEASSTLPEASRRAAAAYMAGGIVAMVKAALDGAFASDAEGEALVIQLSRGVLLAARHHPNRV